MSDFNELMDRAASELPEGWYIRILVENGSASVDLYGPDSHEPDLYEDEASMSQQFSAAITMAKQLDTKETNE